MQNRLLYDYHTEKNKLQEQKTFRLFVLAQFFHYGTLLVLLLGGLFFIVVALKAFV